MSIKRQRIFIVEQTSIHPWQAINPKITTSHKRFEQTGKKALGIFGIEGKLINYFSKVSSLYQTDILSKQQKYKPIYEVTNFVA